jgi:acetyl esterase
MTYVRRDVQALLDLMAAQPAPTLIELGAVAGREMYRVMGSTLDLPRGDIAEVNDLSIPGPAGAIRARLYRNHNNASAPVLVYFHGGGWVIGDLDSHDGLCAEIARATGLTVVAIDYREAPEHPFPAAADDCLAATRWVAGSPAELGQSVSGIVVAGDSAGGNLAAVVAQQLTDALPVPLLLQWLIYPAVDMVSDYVSLEQFADGYVLTKEVMRWFETSYAPSAEQRANPMASPLLAATVAGQPPALVITCGLDPLRDQGRAYAAKLVAAGVPVRFRELAGVVHGAFNLRAGLPGAQADLAQAAGDVVDMLQQAGG